MTGQAISAETRIEIKYREDARGNAGKPVLEGSSILPASTKFTHKNAHPNLGWALLFLQTRCGLHQIQSLRARRHKARRSNPINVPHILTIHRNRVLQLQSKRV